MSGPGAPGLKALMLRPPGLWLAMAESMTCGLLQARVGAISGASAFFRGGITAYSLDQKVRHLGVDRSAAKACDCVSVDVAGQMARGACALFDADVAVATTGYAEPSALPPVAHPYAWWAIAFRDGAAVSVVRSGRIDCPGAARTEARERVADGVMAALADWLATRRT
jgi:nicotinamide-nucleotide amidase